MVVNRFAAATVALADLKSLGFTSMLGTSGLFYTAVMMAIRFFDGSYAAGGKFHALLPAGGAPVFDVKGTNPICFLVRGCIVVSEKPDSAAALG